MSFRAMVRMGLGAVVVLSGMTGCGSSSSTATGTTATPADKHDSRNKEMGDFMKSQEQASQQ